MSAQNPSIAARRRRAAAAQQAPQKRRRKKERKKIPTVDLHVRVALEDMLIRISAADYQKLVIYWMLGEETVILRGPYDNMETDIVLRGNASGIVSVRQHQSGSMKVPPFKLVRASDARNERLEQAGL